MCYVLTETVYYLRLYGIQKKLIIFISDVYQNPAKLSIGSSFPLLNSNQNCVTSFHVRFVKFEMIHPRSFVFANHHVMQKCMQTCVLKSISVIKVTKDKVRPFAPSYA